MKSSQAPTAQHGSALKYFIGFGLSLGLTLGAYSLATQPGLDGWPLIAAITGLALIQLIVQLLFFLHVGRKRQSASDDPTWDRLVLYFTVLIIFIVVAGSVWIMNNVHGYDNSRHDGQPQPSPQEIERQLIREEGINRQ